MGLILPVNQLAHLKSVTHREKRHSGKALILSSDHFFLLQAFKIFNQQGVQLHWRIIQKPSVKFFEVAAGVFAGISPYRGISWANAGFINKGEGLVYDTFFDLFHAREMREAYKEVSNGGSPAYVVNSHYNSDHAWGNKVFEDACIIMHKEASRERLTENISWMDNVIRRGKDSLESTSGDQRVQQALQ
nr:MBL fold metallo-hydrolase [Paenibacillus silagei]